MTAPPEDTRHPRRGRALAVALFIPPLAVLANLEMAYALVDAACKSRTSLPLHLVNAGWLGVAITGGLVSWRSWQAVGNGWPEEGGSVALARFIAGVALLLSGICVLAIAAQWIAVFVLDPCQ
ncbi:MAG: hypothetical protein QOH59_1032 [Gemmatimonadales bacterium]|jgi:hypothetical protein|nr:hypothetical protein [Gemmatimonadales bacterium]